MAISKLKSAGGIEAHIEKMTQQDVRAVVQTYTMQDILSSTQSKREKTIAQTNVKTSSSEHQSAAETKSASPSLPLSALATGSEHTQYSRPPAFAPSSEASAPDLTPMQSVTEKLGAHLAEYGIHVIMVTIEHAMNLNKELAAEMEKVATETSKAQAQQSLISINLQLNRAKAQQEAEVAKIAMTQKNSNLEQEAQTKFQIAELEAKSAVAKAKGEAEALTLKLNAQAEAEANATKIKLSAEGEALTKHPALLQLRMAEQFAKLLGNVTNFSMGENAGMASAAASFFSGFSGRSQATAQLTQQAPAEQKRPGVS